MSFEAHVVTPEREVWAGPVQQVVARGVDGVVGILNGHAPLLVQLAIGPLRLELPDGTWRAAIVDGGFLHVTSTGGETRADVLATQAELAEEIDVEAARRRLEELRAAEDDDEVAQAEAAKALARIELAG
ncbi:MAG TPA: ATP synthase F1 subunit epsilon [Actinomycetota bacterium]|nr:ATP synthase F1 subunit epsilon [Actinomycetota bacterium]